MLATIEDGYEFDIVGLLDDDISKRGAIVYGYRVLGGREQLAALKGRGVGTAVVAIGDNFTRVEVARMLAGHGFRLATPVHSSVTRLRGSPIGAGTVVLPHAHVGADARIGDNVILSASSVVGHDCVVGAGTLIAPHATLAGGVRVGDFSVIGISATILPNLTVGDRVTVGANAVVVDCLPDDVTAVGVPARIIRRGTTR